MKRETHTIDVSGKAMGRIATQIVILLRGKHRPDFVPYKDAGDIVIVKNVEKMKFSGKKVEQKLYYRHSGYLGSLKKKPLKVLLEENPFEALRRAVWGMLPKNKLRSEQIKRLSPVK